MNPRYRATFRRHRPLFLLPVLLGMVFGLLVALGSPTLYRSNATLAIKSLDTASSQFGALPPAAQNQAMLTELLATRTFVDNVAVKSPLEEYLKTHTSMGWGPTTLLKRALKGPPSLEQRIAEAIERGEVHDVVFDAENVRETPLGDAPVQRHLSPFESPQVMVSAAGLLPLAEVHRERTRLQSNALTAATASFTKARTQLTQAQTDLNTYSHTHPGSTTTTDPELKSLTNAVLQAVRGVRAAANVMNTASAAVSGGTGLPATVSTFDKPRLPIGPTTGKKRVVELAIVGAFVGALLSFLGIVFLSRPGTGETPFAVRQLMADEPSPNGDDPKVSEHERAAQLLAGQERHLREIRPE